MQESAETTSYQHLAGATKGDSNHSLTDNNTEASTNESSPSCTNVTVKFPIALQVLLFLSSLAQYTGSSAVGLYLVRTLLFGPIATNDFWMYMGFLGFFNPVVGWVSDVFTIRQERRRPCLMLGLCADALCLFLMANVGEHIPAAHFIVLGLAQTLAESMVIIPLNAMVVELTKNPNAIVEDKPTCIGRAYQQLKRKIAALVCRRNTEDEEKNEKKEEEEEGDTPREGSVAWEEKRRLAASGSAQSYCMAVRSVGSVVGGLLETVALTKVDPAMVLLGSGVAWGVCLIPVLFLPRDCTKNPIDIKAPQSFSGEGRQQGDQQQRFSLPQRASKGWRRLRESCSGGIRSSFSGLIAVLVFVFVYCAVPSAATIYYQYISWNFNFPNWYLSLNSTVGNFMSIIACVVYQQKLASLSQVKVFVVGCACMSAGYLTNIMLASGFSKDTLHISDRWFVMVDTMAVNFCMIIGFLPVVHIASSRCPKGFESFVFELFSAASLGASSFAALLTSFIAGRLQIESGGYSKLWVLLVICAVGKWIPVIALAILPRAVDKVSSSSSRPALSETLLTNDSLNEIMLAEEPMNDDGVAAGRSVSVSESAPPGAGAGGAASRRGRLAAGRGLDVEEERRR